MRASFVVDTSVLISDPKFFQHYPSSDIILPISVLSELDKLKKGSNETARNARVSIRFLDEISELGDLSTGILLENGALIKVDATSYEVPKELGDPNYADNQILICAHQNSLSNSETTLLSNDINVRVKARSKGIQAEAHKSNNTNFNEVYQGFRVVKNDDAAGELVCNGSIDPTAYGIELNPNEFAIFKDENDEDIVTGRLVSPNELRKLKKSYPWKLSPRNNEQTMAVDLIMDQNLSLVSLSGIAGSGKTILSAAACLDLLLNKKAYDKLIIYRPMQAVGPEIGFLAGDLIEKTDPWFQAIFDTFEILFTNKNGNWRNTLQMYQENGKIELSVLTFVRGRSLNSALIFIDECQNIPKDQIKTILSRTGMGSKVVINGDESQVDNNKLDSTDNGLVHVIESFKNSYIAGHVSLLKGERSELATLSAKIL